MSLIESIADPTLAIPQLRQAVDDKLSFVGFRLVRSLFRWAGLGRWCLCWSDQHLPPSPGSTNARNAISAVAVRGPTGRALRGRDAAFVEIFDAIKVIQPFAQDETGKTTGQVVTMTGDQSSACPSFIHR